MANTSASFGTYTLAPWRESVRRVASHTPNNKLGMWMISILRKISLLAHTPGMDGPLDIEVAEGVKARLYPRSNRCEKRAYAGVHIWDSSERKTLDEAIANKDGTEKFIFLDVGSNVGLYSLFVNASAKKHNKKIKIIAVEPDEENRSRLQFNLKASDCAAVVEPIGISDEVGEGVLSEAGKNRGGISIMDSGDGVSIKLETLAGLIKRHRLTHVDAMKIDIEGRDEAALLAMVQSAPKKLWPRLLVVEIGRIADSSIVKQMEQHGYQLKERVGINAILEFSPARSAGKKGVV